MQDFSSIILTRDLITDQTPHILPCNIFEWQIPGIVCPPGGDQPPMTGRIFGRTTPTQLSDLEFEHLKGSATIHVFADLDFRPKDLPQETKDALGYVPGQDVTGVGGQCVTVPNGPAGYLLFFAVNREGLPMGGNDCDGNIATVTELNERIHLEIPFDNSNPGVKPFDFWFHLHEDSTAALTDPENSAFASVTNITVRIDFDEVENPEWWD